MSSKITKHLVHRMHPTARGFSLVELMVALAISFFIIAGMLTIFENVHSTYSTQTALANLEDNERLAMTLITDVVSSAGYFPDPSTYTAIDTLAASPHFTAAGSPAIAGGTTALGDTITVRYAPDTTGDLYNCFGGTNANAPYDEWENTFSIVSTGGISGALQCTFWSKSGANIPPGPIPLVQGLTNGTGGSPKGIQILYGVGTGKAAAPTCVDTYKSIADMTAADWAQVCTLKVTLSFVNPVAPAGSLIKWVSFTRVIAVMNAAGAST